jgi:hypothetical protein
MTYVIAQFEIIQFASLTPFRSYHTPYPLPTAKRQIFQLVTELDEVGQQPAEESIFLPGP